MNECWVAGWSARKLDRGRMTSEVKLTYRGDCPLHMRKRTAHLTSSFGVKPSVTINRRGGWRRSAAGPCVSLRRNETLSEHAWSGRSAAPLDDGM
jgi:hypothetical protein